ncbi:class I SAM-dependent methyltransferase [Nonomuraea sp. bgisy101]|uniref:class I SAM-dependent methyltransferase n=1 Tax=Nonomuraea sp. bgisy101 TaxID=3413784 RepID=UPI003D70A282
MPETSANADTERRDALADRLFRDTIAMQEMLHIYVGDRLGLYTALAGAESMSPQELADQAGIAERYAREWLEQQAVAGILDVMEDDGGRRRYRLPPGADEVLCEPESLYYMAPFAPLVVSLAQALPQVVEAFRSGGGVPYEAYPGVADAIARGNRPMFVNQLAAEWIPALPDIEARLRGTDPPARVADLGCGTGWSTLALARAYPDARVDGIDLDEGSIETARGRAERSGLAERVTFACRDAADPGLSGRYDLVTLFETLHDMSRPVEVLRAVRGMLAPGGTVLVGDEKVAETFTAPGDDVERFQYGWSALHCLAASMVDPESAATGTVIRPETVRRYADEAGFSNVTILPVEHDLWRFYRLDP